MSQLAYTCGGVQGVMRFRAGMYQNIPSFLEICNTSRTSDRKGGRAGSPMLGRHPRDRLVRNRSYHGGGYDSHHSENDRSVLERSPSAAERLLHLRSIHSMQRDCVHRQLECTVDSTIFRGVCVRAFWRSRTSQSALRRLFNR